jgi:hypothetical protein
MFYDFIDQYRLLPPKSDFEKALIQLAKEVCQRLVGTEDMPLYRARNFGLRNLLIGAVTSERCTLRQELRQELKQEMQKILMLEESETA